jgi:hypothetical protein
MLRAFRLLAILLGLGLSAGAQAHAGRSSAWSRSRRENGAVRLC